jgi:hypothetical protein
MAEAFQDRLALLDGGLQTFPKTLFCLGGYCTAEQARWFEIAGGSTTRVLATGLEGRGLFRRVACKPKHETAGRKAANLCRDLPPSLEPSFAFIPFRYRPFRGDGLRGCPPRKGYPSAAGCWEYVVSHCCVPRTAWQDWETDCMFRVNLSRAKFSLRQATNLADSMPISRYRGPCRYRAEQSGNPASLREQDWSVCSFSARRTKKFRQGEKFFRVFARFVGLEDQFAVRTKPRHSFHR